MTPRIDTSQVVTIATATKRLSTSRQAVWEAITRGRLKTVDVAGVTFITLKSLEDYLKTRRPWGGPKSKRKTTKT